LRSSSSPVRAGVGEDPFGARQVSFPLRNGLQNVSKTDSGAPGAPGRTPKPALTQSVWGHFGSGVELWSRGMPPGHPTSETLPRRNAAGRGDSQRCATHTHAHTHAHHTANTAGRGDSQRSRVLTANTAGRGDSKVADLPPTAGSARACFSCLAPKNLCSRVGHSTVGIWTGAVALSGSAIF